MFKKPLIKKILFFVIITTLILVELANNHLLLRIISGALILIIISLKIKCLDKENELKTLSIDYNNQKQLLYDIFKYCPDLIFYKNKDFEYAGCNEAFVKINDLNSEKEILGKTDFDMLSRNHADEIREQDADVLKTKTAKIYQISIANSKGEEKTYEILKAPLNFNNETLGLLGIGRDITDNIKLHKSIIEKQAQLNAFLDAMPFVAYLKDLNGRPTIGNSNYRELLDNPDKNIKGLDLQTLSAADKIDGFTEEDKRVIKMNEVLVSEKEIETESGILWLEIHKAPVFNEQDGATGIVVIIKNITIEKENDLQKETFISTLTHDLKTPTSAQIRALSLLLNNSFGELKKEQKDIIEQTLNSCKYMFNMISTILSTYKKEHCKTNLKQETFNLTKLVQQCQSEVSYLAKEKGQTIITKYSTDDDEIFADKIEIKRVLINLFSNAILYSAANSEIEISLTDTKETIEFEIKNKTSTISKEEIDKLFDKYFSNSSKFRQVGTGLGLHLSKQIIKNHGGSIIAQSEKETGNIFGFTIPKTYSEIKH